MPYLRALRAAALLSAIFPLITFAADVDFSTEHPVAAGFDGAIDVHAADIDGDGDMDVVGAAQNANDVTWWENTSGDGSTWTQHLIDGAFARAFAVYAADLDGDGDIDILGAAGEVQGEMVWWENTAGNGSAWTKRTVDADYDGARSIIAADIDSDGDLDVVGAAWIAGMVSWWENTAGNASAWTEHVLVQNFTDAHPVFAADINGDGDTDIVAAARNGNTVAWWENDTGDGSSFTMRTIDTSFRDAASVFVADVDGDGDMDVLGAAEIDDDLTWWENAIGSGTIWVEHNLDVTYDGSIRVQAADIDADGDIDVISQAYEEDVITWWENAGAGSGWTRHNIASGLLNPYGLLVIDMDGDGDIDVLSSDNAADTVTWWENVLTFGDTDGDGITDDVDNCPLVANANQADADGDTVGDACDAFPADPTESVDSDGDGVGDNADAFPNDPNETTDTDGDGVGDNADAFPNDPNEWQDTDGDGIGDNADPDVDGDGIPDNVPPFDEHPVSIDFSDVNSVSAADVDGDGDTDIVGAAGGASGQVTWWENTAPNGLSWVERTVDSEFDGAVSVSATDVDGDGDIDIVAAGSAEGVAWWENTAGDGSAWNPHVVSAAYVARSMVTEDVDGDGDMDIMAVKYAQLGAGGQDDTVVWWENIAGDGSAWQGRLINTQFDKAMSVFAADVDGDGDTDALAASWWNGICWWSNLGGSGTSWSTRFVGGGGTDPTCSPLQGVILIGISSVSAADVDGDGDMDLLGTAEVPPFGGWVKWWENTAGNGSSWRMRTISSSMDNARAVTAADLDGDGDLDVIASAVGGASKVAWWENTAGDGSVWTENAVADAFNGGSIFAADFDSDGGMDILGAGNGAAISWWENTDNCPLIPHSDQTDTDLDGFGDVCDAFPNDPNETADSDGDGVGDNADLYPNDPTESADTDGDGVGDNADAFPNDPNETVDTDGDGVGDNADLDDDGDGVPDVDDDYPLGRFDDARPGYWAFSFIEALARAGITAGCGNGNYCPTAPVTRAQMAVFLERGMNGSNFSPPAASGNVFLDVGALDFAASFIEQLANDGITAGCGNNNYCPDAEVTRDQMAVFLLRAKYGSGYSPPPATGVFADVDLSYWAVAWIEQLAVEGITAGCGGGNYCPTAAVTRDQMAVFLVRTFGL